MMHDKDTKTSNLGGKTPTLDFKHGEAQQGGTRMKAKTPKPFVQRPGTTPVGG